MCDQSFLDRTDKMTTVESLANLLDQAYLHRPNTIAQYIVCEGLTTQQAERLFQIYGRAERDGFDISLQRWFEDDEKDQESMGPKFNGQYELRIKYIG